MGINLYLDDVRAIPAGFTGVRNYEEFVEFIEMNGIPELISFDHDLGEGKSGYDCAKFLVEYCLDRNISKINFKVHSQNPVGKENIEGLLTGFNNFRNKKINGHGLSDSVVYFAEKF